MSNVSEFVMDSFQGARSPIAQRQAADEYACRIELFGDQIEGLQLVYPVTGELPELY